MKAKGVVAGLGAAGGANDGSLKQTGARTSEGAPMKLVKDVAATSYKSARIGRRPRDQRRAADVRRAASRRPSQHRQSRALSAARLRYPRQRLAVQQRADRAGIRAADCRVSRRQALRRDVQRHDRAGNRDPRARSQRRGDRSVVHVHRHRACAAMAGDHADLRRYRPGNAQPRSGRGLAHDHAAHHRHHRRASVGPRRARQGARGHRQTSTSCG